MGHKFQDQYRVPSARLQNWDYGWDASYFVTICTEGMQKFFGDIEENKMILNEIGEIANYLWLEIANQFQFVVIDEYVIMPNHIHGIILIEKLAESNPKDAINRVSTDEGRPTGGFAGSMNPMLNENLSRIIRWFKGRVSFECRTLDPVFAWQSRFHDHIIRNEESYHTISTYIKNNPSNWEDDKFYL